MTIDLTPAENIALTVARAQIDRGEAPTPNVAATLVLALIRLVDEKPDPGAAFHLLTGELPPGVYSPDPASGAPAQGRLLVHVWGDGTGEVAYRETNDTRTRWGTPAALTPAP